MIDEKDLLEKLSIYLYLGRKGLMSYAFILSILPVKIIGLIACLQKGGRYYYGVLPILVFGIIGTWVHGSITKRRNKVCREILNIKTSSHKGSPRLQKSLSISKWELALLMSLILSPLAFISGLLFFKEYRKMTADYDAEVGVKGNNIENILNQTIKISHKKGR